MKTFAACTAVRLALGLGNACRVVFRDAADDLGTAEISTWSLLFARALLAAPEGPDLQFVVLILSG
jgi:hypothetical protein